ncbi:phox-associated domain,Sorting nexin [Artemisia annua]|uniref:Phox-associated domain,Sorting nexin n=1 Tax=Artemisia annua TaxID=35608 RepID=A0A2U1L9W5_ARTAN|nr:phox-associated domain,Sorting nexin [Artemisia annua]
MSSSVRQSVTVRDLIDESKKRLVLLAVCGVGLSYLMSLTSASVLINLPAALFLIVGLRYFALDYEMRRKAAVYNSNPSSTNLSSQKKPAMAPKPLSGKSDWRRKVNSPVVEDAIDQFTKHIVSEWVTDLWYSRVTPDKQGPDELVLIINGVLGEFSSRMRNINLIDLLTRDIIKLFCTHLELFRACQMKITKQQTMTIAQRDVELKAVLYAENKLHPALFSPGAEHKVLQHLMDGFISFTFRPEDLQCSLFRYIVREMLACAVIRPVVNLANPRFINERIENVVISASKNNKIITNEQMNSQPKSNGSPKLSNQPSMLIDPSVKGVELTQLKKDNSDSVLNNVTTALHSKDPLLSIDTRKQLSGGEWGDKLDIISRRKAEVLAPEHFENMWAKGKDYKTKENVKHFTEPVKNSLARSSNPVNHSKPLASHKDAYGPTKGPRLPLGTSYEEDEDEDEDDDEEEYRNNIVYSSEDEENSDITGINSPGTKVWDGKNNRKNSVTYIHHPLESYEGQKMRKTGKDYSTGRKRSRVSSQKDVWLEIERKSFLLEDGLDVLGSSKGHSKSGDSSGDSEGGESLGRTNSGTSTSSFFPAISTNNVQKGSSLDDSFFRLRCEVLGANIVKSGSKTFAVYPISVTDVNNVSWSIKRRFRHFEELHRRLKEYPEYNLHLPPKHFLSTGLDVDVIQERCKLLDIYLKRLMQFPTISGCIEVWDFLSVDSQTYSFSNSISIIETLSVNSAANVRERSTEVGTTGVGFAGDPLTSRRELSDGVIKNSLSEVKNSSLTDGSKASKKNAVSSLGKPVKRSEDSDSDHEIVVPSNISSTIKSGQFVKGLDDNTLSKQSGMLAGDGDSIPSEWVPPNLSIPMFDLVDVVFQLQDGGWIRRKVFWVAKQVLQLGMSDAFDDWLIAKIQLLRRGSIVASGIKRLEQILWPDGIFITKHPKRQQPTPTPRVPQVSPNGQQPPSPGGHPPSDEETLSPEELQEREARRRSKLVYELMIDKAPAAVVSIFGRKEYEQCVQDVYYFIQSSVCLKQLAFDLLELLLMSAFPEMDSVFQQLQDEKQKFGFLEQ